MAKYGSKKWLQFHIKDLQNIVDFMQNPDSITCVEENGKALTFGELAFRNLIMQVRGLKEF